jgi:hypothetical protein
MTKLFSVAVMVLLATVAPAQETPPQKPPAPPQQHLTDMVISIGVDQPGPRIPAAGGPLNISPTFADSVTPAQRVVLQTAINDWMAIVQDSGSTMNPYPISFAFTATPCNNPNFLACTVNTFNRTTGDLISSSMTFTSVANTFWEDPLNPPPSNLYDLLSVARHELGHALGWDAAPLGLKNLLAANTSVATIASGNGAVRSANVVTITPTSPHGLVVGDTVTISGVTDGSFNGTFTITAPAICTTTPTFTYAQTGPNATSGGGSVSTGVFAAPRLNIPFVTASGLHTEPAWRPNDLMVPCSVQGVRLSISLHPAASLVARGYAYVIPMQFVDPTSTGTEDGSAVNPWQTVFRACGASPLGTPLLLSNATHIVPAFFRCANRHVVNGARGGAFVRP